MFLSLTDTGGCAALGAQSTAPLVIHDDDTQLPTTPTFHVGGTVTGLHGSGLLLREVVTDSTIASLTDGAFVFSSTVLDGASYYVRIQNQPNNPAQSCTVSTVPEKLQEATSPILR